jgi:hypothetical protein
MIHLTFLANKTGSKFTTSKNGLSFNAGCVNSTEGRFFSPLIMIRIPAVVKLFLLVTFVMATLVVVFQSKSVVMDLPSSTSQKSSHETASLQRTTSQKSLHEETTSPQRTSSSPPNRPFTGELNVHPVGLQGRCVTFRFRGKNESMSMDEAVDYLQTTTAATMYSDPASQGSINKRPLHVGIVFVDEPDGFLSLAHGVFHLFHFLEFLAVGYTELHRLASAGTGTGTRSPSHQYQFLGSMHH